MSHYAIVKWAEFQHYKDRSPPWIKLHRSLLTSETWVSASTNGKVLAVACMMLAADTGNKIPANPRYIQRAAYLDFVPDFSELVALGFLSSVDPIDEIRAERDPVSDALADASKPQADARPEERRGEEEKKEELPSPPSVVRSPLKSRGEFLSRDWKPCLEGQRMAVDAMGSRDAALEQLAQFRDYWFAKSGSDGRKRDWDAAWRNWIRKALEYGKRNGNHQRQHRPASGHDNVLTALDELLGGGDHGSGGPPGASGAIDAERDAEGVYQFSH